MSSGYVPDHDATQVLAGIERGTVRIAGSTPIRSIAPDRITVRVKADPLDYFWSLLDRGTPRGIAMRMAQDYAERHPYETNYTLVGLDDVEAPPQRIACKSNYNGTRRRLPVHPQHP